MTGASQRCLSVYCWYLFVILKGKLNM